MLKRVLAGMHTVHREHMLLLVLFAEHAARQEPRQFAVRHAGHGLYAVQHAAKTAQEGGTVS